MKTFLSVFLSLTFCSIQLLAQDSQPRVGRDEASKYFEPVSESARNVRDRFGSSDHYLALHFGRYMSSQSYDWSAAGQADDVGGNSAGVTYRVGEWHNSMDLNLRIDYQEYKDLGPEKPSKLSFMPLLTFPDASSKFPLYFGMGAGLGVFLKQIDKKSALSFDYLLVAGARFFDVFENTGFFIEAGLKNQLLILSSGQLNGTFLAAGLVFTF